MTEEIRIGGQPVTVEVAKNDAHRYRGLSGHTFLGKNEGMLFVWPMEKEHGLVMRDMDFGVDMVFADSNGNVTKIHSTDADGEGTTAFSKYAVELPQGWCDKSSVQKGDMLELTGDTLGKFDTPTVKDEIAKQAVESVSAKAWIPYQGPQGGEGWQNGANPDDVRYVPDPPGEVAPEYQEMAEDWGSDEEEDGGSDDSPDVPESGTDQREEGYFVSAQPNPEEDVKRFQEDEGVSESIQATNEEPMEGFTVQRNLDSYDVWSDDVWMVGVDSVEFDTDRGISKDDVTEFYEEQLPALEASPALRIGGYHFDDGSKISIDISVTLTDQEEAEQLGEQMKQESIFNPKKAMDTDFEEGSVMTYEGDDVGESPVESPEEIKEILTNLQSLAKALVTAALRAALAKQMGEGNMSEEPRDMDARFENEAGETVSRAQIFRRGWKESADVESTEEGYIVDGELFRTVE